MDNLNLREDIKEPAQQEFLHYLQLGEQYNMGLQRNQNQELKKSINDPYKPRKKAVVFQELKNLITQIEEWSTQRKQLIKHFTNMQKLLELQENVLQMISFSKARQILLAEFCNIQAKHFEEDKKQWAQGEHTIKYYLHKLKISELKSKENKKSEQH